MKFDFGENLKSLRNRKGLTQEQVAELLNVSKQSVSRWENNITYPDITFLPILASFYCVTVDYLLGTDYETNKKIVEEYQKKRHEAHHQGDMCGAYELSQELYTLFPNEKTVLNAVMSDTYLMGFHNVDGKRKHYLDMSISISERFLKITDDIEEQCRCIKNIATCNKLLGNQDKAEEWTKKLPSIWSGIEGTAIAVFEGQDKKDIIQNSLDAVLHMFHRLVYVYAKNEEFSPEERIRILEKTPAIFDIIWENGDYGFYHMFVSAIYLEIARLYSYEPMKGIAALKKSVYHAKVFDSLVESQYTSLLFRGMPISPAEFTKPRKTNRIEEIMLELSKTDFDFLRGTKELDDILNELK